VVIPVLRSFSFRVVEQATNDKHKAMAAIDVKKAGFIRQVPFSKLFIN